MKSKWKVTWNPTLREKQYGVYRLRNVEGIDHSGNRENYGSYYATEDEAAEVAARLNDNEGD